MGQRVKDGGVVVAQESPERTQGRGQEAVAWLGVPAFAQGTLWMKCG